MSDSVTDTDSVSIRSLRRWTSVGGSASAARFREAFSRDGFVILSGAVPDADCARMRERLWGALEGAHRMRRDDPTTWPAGMPRHLSARLAPETFAAVDSPAVTAAVDILLGAGNWAPPRIRAQALPNLPGPGPWTLPARMWHLDYPLRSQVPAEPLFAVKLLCLLAPLGPGEGATLLLRGSHGLVLELAAAGVTGQAGEIRRRLCRRYPELAGLFAGDEADPARQRYLEGKGFEVAGRRLEVVEFTGETGDVVLFHPWLFHNASPNCGARPRLQVGQNLTTHAGFAIYRPPAAQG